MDLYLQVQEPTLAPYPTHGWGTTLTKNSVGDGTIERAALIALIFLGGQSPSSFLCRPPLHYWLYFNPSLLCVLLLGIPPQQLSDLRSLHNQIGHDQNFYGAYRPLQIETEKRNLMAFIHS